MSYWRLFYHITWSVHDRLPLINPAWEKRLYAVIAEKAREMRSVVHAVGGVADHVHLAVSVPPSVPLSRFVGEVKGASSHFANHNLNLDFCFAWQSSYGVVSFGETNLPRVVRYVQMQKEHHAQHSTILGMERDTVCT